MFLASRLGPAHPLACAAMDSFTRGPKVADWWPREGSRDLENKQNIQSPQAGKSWAKRTLLKETGGMGLSRSNTRKQAVCFHSHRQNPSPEP